MSGERLWAVPALGARPVNTMLDPSPFDDRSPLITHRSPFTIHRSPFTARHLPRTRVSGFTLLELLVVMAIVGMLAALVAPRIGSSEGSLFRAQVREAVAALNYARRSAIIQGYPAEAVLQPGGVTDPGEGHWVSRGVSLSVLEGKVPEGKDAPFKVTFFPEGGSSGGELALKLGTRTATIRIDAVTGRVRAKLPGEEG
ncbi:hypothetical protein JCM17961_17480 [Endothiovibrio diazotrophicus]